MISEEVFLLKATLFNCMTNYCGRHVQNPPPAAHDSGSELGVLVSNLASWGGSQVRAEATIFRKDFFSECHIVSDWRLRVRNWFIPMIEEREDAQQGLVILSCHPGRRRKILRKVYLSTCTRPFGVGERFCQFEKPVWLNDDIVIDEREHLTCGLKDAAVQRKGLP